MGIFADSGLITRGLGIRNKVIIRGMAINFDVGGVIPFWRHKEFEFNIFVSILKEFKTKIQIFSSMKVSKNKQLKIYSGVQKSNKKAIDISSDMDYSNLIEIIDNI